MSIVKWTLLKCRFDSEVVHAWFLCWSVILPRATVRPCPLKFCFSLHTFHLFLLAQSREVLQLYLIRPEVKGGWSPAVLVAEVGAGGGSWADTWVITVMLCSQNLTIQMEGKIPFCGKRFSSDFNRFLGFFFQAFLCWLCFVTAIRVNKKKRSWLLLSEFYILL